MKMKDLGITSKSLYESVYKQTKKGTIGFFSHSITKEEAEAVTKFSFEKIEIESLDFLKLFPKITNLSFCQLGRLGNMEGIAYLTHLKNLSIYDTYIDDFTPLTECRELEYLDYMFEEHPRDVYTQDFRFLRLFPQLYQIDLSGNNIRNVKFLENALNIKQLVLTGNPLESIEGIETLKNLEYLEMENCGLTDLTGVEKLLALKSLHVSDNQFSEEQVAEYLIKFGHISNLTII